MSAHSRGMGALRRFLLGGLLLGLAMMLATGLTVYIAAGDAPGKAPEGTRLQRMRRSPQWRGDGFTNVLQRVDGPWLEMLRRWLLPSSAQRVPNAPVSTVPRRGKSFGAPQPGRVEVTWFGHSSMLLDIDGYRVLIDPVFGERCSPLSFMGPARFFAPPLPLSELPVPDAVVISHDHYDHLDTPTVRALARRGLRWVVPLGVGAHLEAWGVAPQSITELDWWEQTRVRDLTLIATPARHFSGRSLAFTDANGTLWAGWVFKTPQRRVYYSGDTALFDELIEIGNRHGPFDLTMIEVGAYNRLWRDVHLGPEQAVRAHRLVQGKLMFPVHWGLFDLAIHAWTEPIERVLVAAAAEGVRVVAPRAGETVDVDAAPAPQRWWPTLPFQTAREHDVRSTGVDHLLGAELPAAVHPHPR